MNHLSLNNLRLTARNEGKIKSYDSCTDLRAWSHDVATQDRYLREWMKSDAPVCFIPCRCFTDCLCKMTCKSRRRATPHCHPGCKSRAILDSICKSCQAIKECLEQDDDLEKFFIEEELETSHWPCDGCLEPLKAIKMFWKILVYKLFGINLSKLHGCMFETGRMLSVKSVARVWQEDLQNQACYVKKLVPGFCRGNVCTRSTTCSTSGGLISSLKSLNSCCVGNNRDIKLISPPCPERVSRCTSIRFKNIDHGCSTCEIENEQLCAYRRKVAVLQAKCDAQCENINRLRKQNHLLKSKIENICRGCPWKASYCVPENESVGRRSRICIPKPFETPLGAGCSPVNDVESEMIITMENSKNESFRHVSLLQVLHKTNVPILKDLHASRPCSKKEDPIAILNKVHCTVGAIVKREMSIANERNCQANNTKVDASFHTVHNCKSAPSCISMSSCSPRDSSSEFVTMFRRCR